VPLLGFGKERLDPDLPFPHRLPVYLSGMVAPDLLQVVRIEGAVDDAAVVAGRALGLDRARVAGRRVGPIDDLFSMYLVLQRGKGCPCGQRYLSAVAS
jgi:hypothetical protein